MDKYRQAYSLEAIKKAFSNPEQLGGNITLSAFSSAQEVGFTTEDIIKAIQMLKQNNFYKSMNSYADYKIWQDVYYLTYQGVKLYIKFSIKENGKFLLLSFKEK